MNVDKVKRPRPAESDQMITETSTSMQFQASMTEGFQKRIRLESGSDNKTHSEAKVEKAFESAVSDLHKAMSKISSEFRIPECITLKKFQSIGDVDVMARELETEIENFISLRKLDVSLNCKKKWISCVKHWFLAVFPLLNSFLGIAEVAYIKP